MLLAGGGRSIEVIEEILIDEVIETTTSTGVVEIDSFILEKTQADTFNLSWLILLLVILILVGIGIYQMVRGKKNVKTMAKKGK